MLSIRLNLSDYGLLSDGRFVDDARRREFVQRIQAGQSLLLRQPVWIQNTGKVAETLSAMIWLKEAVWKEAVFSMFARDPLSASCTSSTRSPRSSTAASTWSSAACPA